MGHGGEHEEGNPGAAVNDSDESPREKRRRTIAERAARNGGEEPERTLTDRLDEADAMLREAGDSDDN